MTRRIPLLMALGLLACSGGDDSVSTPDEGVPTADTSPPDDTGELFLGSVPATAAEHGEVTCADSGQRSNVGPFERGTAPDPPNHDLWIWGGALMTADLDGDGWLDVLAPTEYGLQLYEGGPTGFIERGIEVFGPLDLTYGTGGSIADYDGDGDLDVYASRFTGFPAEPGGPDQGRNRLLRNDGDFTFVDVTDTAGVDGCGYDRHADETRCFRTMASSWGDIDRDGDLDLFVGNYGFVDETPGITQDLMEPAEPSMLYLNDGDGTFTDISDMLPDELDDGYTYAGGLFDLDDDGWLDLYTVNDFGNKWPNRVLWNDQGTLVFDPNDTSGLVVQTTGMGLGLGDLNGDGVLDVAMPAWATNLYLESRRDLGIWLDTASTNGFTVDFADKKQKVGWGTLMGDIDNDGDLDIVSQFGHVANENPVWSNPPEQPDGLYINTPGSDGAPSFDDEATAWGVADLGMGRGAMVADLNRDGWLDIGKRDLNGPNVNYLSRCGAQAWAIVHLRQPGTMNTHAVGAKVVIETAGRSMLRHVFSGGTGFGAGEPPEIHFGLGDVDRIERITVTWPDGETSVLTDLGSRQQITITR